MSNTTPKPTVPTPSAPVKKQNDETAKNQITRQEWLETFGDAIVAERKTPQEWAAEDEEFQNFKLGLTRDPETHDLTLISEKPDLKAKATEFVKKHKKAIVVVSSFAAVLGLANMISGKTEEPKPLEVAEHNEVEDAPTDTTDEN